MRGPARLTAYLAVFLSCLVVADAVAEKRRTPKLRCPRTFNADIDECEDTLDDFVGSLTNGAGIRYTTWWRDLPTLAPPLPLSRDGHASDARGARPVEKLCLDCVPGSNPCQQCNCSPLCGLGQPCTCDPPCGAVAINDGTFGTPGPGKRPDEVGWRCDLQPASAGCFACEDLSACCVGIGEACSASAPCCEGFCSDGVCVTGGSDCCEQGMTSVGFCNVLSLGAIPNDGIDDTAAFQKCFNLAVGDPAEGTHDCAATSGGFNHSGIVYAPAGVYDICNLDEPLTFGTGALISDGASLLGDGAQATVLRCLHQLGDCAGVSQQPSERACAPALAINSDPCIVSYEGQSSNEAHGSATLRGFSLIGPGFLAGDSSQGVRTANTDGILTLLATNPGMLIEDVEVLGFDTGIVAMEQASLRASGIWSNFDNVAVSENGGDYDEVMIGSAGRAGFLLTPDGGAGSWHLKGAANGSLPVLFYQSRNVCLSFPSCGGPMLQNVDIDFDVGAGLGNAALLSDQWFDADDQAALHCTALHNPLWCCTGAGTGTCPSTAGNLVNARIHLGLGLVDPSTGSIQVTRLIVPYLPDEHTVLAGSLEGRNELELRSSAPFTPRITSSTPYAFRASTPTGGTKLFADDPTLDVLALLDTTNAARIRGCDDLETCTTFVPSTLTSTTTITTTTTTLATAEWCGSAATVSPTGGTVPFDTTGHTNEHYPGTIALDGETVSHQDPKVGADLVYVWTPGASGTARIDSCGLTSCTPGGGVGISVRATTCMSLAVTADGAQRSEGETIARCTDVSGPNKATGGATACSPNTVGAGCALQFMAAAGTPYYIRIGAARSVDCSGAFTVTPP